MLNAGALTFREFAMDEQLPLATVHEAVLEFLRGRDDVVVFGAQAVNAYVDEPRMTQDIDLISTRAEEIANELQSYLHKRFHIAIRIRRVANGRGIRLFQLQKNGNRHLVDIRATDTLPTAQRISQVLVMAPAELLAFKVVSYNQRRGNPKSGTDWRDIAMLLLEFPELKEMTGPVESHLNALKVDQEIIAVWHELVSLDISAEDDDEY